MIDYLLNIIIKILMYIHFICLKFGVLCVLLPIFKCSLYSRMAHNACVMHEMDSSNLDKEGLQKMLLLVF